MFFVKWSLDTNGIYFLSDMICRKVFIIVKMSLTLHKLNSIFVQFCITSQWRLFWTFFLHVVHEFKRYFLRDFELPGYGSRGYFTCFLGPEYLENIFSLPHKNHSPEKTETNWFNFNFWMITFTEFGKFWKIGVLGGFIIQKLKKFSLASSFYEGMRENVFQIFRA